MPCRHVDTPKGPGFRWGRTGAVHLYGGSTGRAPHEAAALAIRGGQALAARRLVMRVDARARPRRRPRYSDRLVRAYEEMLHARVALTARLVTEFAGPMIRAIPARQDAGRVPTGMDIFAVLRAIREGATAAAAGDAVGLVFIGEELDDDVTGSVDDQVGRLFNVPLATAGGSEDAINEWVRKNVGLISSIPAKSLDEVEELVHGAMSGGRPTRDLAADIEARFGVAASRASLIARDQAAKLAGQINQERQTAYGISSYQWSTSGDPRVRQSHADLDGRIFTWAEGAPDGEGGHIHPGEDFECRCDGIPVMGDANRARLVAEAVNRQERELQLMRVSPTVQGMIENRNTLSDWNARRIREIRAGVRSSVGLR